MGTYQLVIGYNSQQYISGLSNGIDSYLLLDTIKDRSVSGNNTVTGQPMQNGDTMSDHTYRQPNTYTINGTFSLNSNKIINLGNSSDYINEFSSSNDRLTRIQDTFESLKKGGFLCKLMFIQLPDNIGQINNTTIINNTNQIRFKIRDNMQLESFSWTEKLNSFDYRLSFKEIVLVNQQEYYNLPADQQIYQNLPTVTAPNANSLSSVLTSDENELLYQYVIKILYDNGYITDAFINYISKQNTESIKNINQSYLGGIVAAVGTGLITIGVLIPGAGTIFAGAIMVALGLAYSIASVINWYKNANKGYKAEKLLIDINNGSAAEGTEKLTNILNSVKTALSKIKTNVSIYTFNSSNNSDQIINQQTLIKCGNKTYVIEITENNIVSRTQYSTGKLEFTVMDTNLKPITNSINLSTPVITNLSQCENASTIWFNDSTNEYEVYLVNLALNDEDIKNDSDKRYRAKNKLSNYSIWVSKGNMSSAIKLVTDAVVNNLMEQGYE